MENELLLKAIENLLDKKLEPIYQRLDKMDERLDKMNKRLDKMDERLDNLEKTQNEIQTTQTTIVRFITEADSEFVKLEEKTKDIDKIKKVINISNVK
jgi:DNA anti-recombination protein RmuC